MSASIVALYALFATTIVAGFHAQKTAFSVPTRVVIVRDVGLFFSAGESVGGAVIREVDVLTLPPSRALERSNRKFSKSPPWLERNDQFRPDQVQSEIKWLEFSLLEHRFSVSDVADIVKAIYFVASGDVPRIVGSVEFCKLLLRLEEPGQKYNILVTKDLILASILHYSECVTARQDGVYEKVERAIRIDGSATHENERTLFLEASPRLDEDTGGRDINGDKMFPASSISLRRKLSVLDRPLLSEGVQQLFSIEALRLARAASRIKRAEILTDVVLASSRVLTKTEYSSINDLLLSVMEDWRALAIRCVASLYRLEGVLKTMPSGTGEYQRRTSDAVLAARHSIRIYANLSHRLGLHRLKSQLEASAFRVLYPRQYSAVSTLFTHRGESMKAVSAFLASQVTKMLNEDETLKSQLEDLEITSRVKEPYSYWKKLVKNRQAQSVANQLFLAPSAEISVADVQDGVALRVILKAVKLTLDESDETTRSRERMLCYYVHRKIRSRWPATDPSRIKDYIQNPKPNGYQSLHHTSVITRNDQTFPFEVQVRSDEMHRIAEFGVAAHWDYKLGTLPAIPRASETDQELISSAPSPEEMKLVAERSSFNEAGESSYIHALENARQSLVRSSVFVFLAGSSSSALEEGQLLSLPAGAQIVDILEELRRGFNNLPTDDLDLQVWRNGNLALLDEVVRNGDVLLLQNMSPSPRELPCIII
jgi:ppGpp synthetase/RelA/SpoT-type nucleotidyltranferase